MEENLGHLDVADLSENKYESLNLCVVQSESSDGLIDGAIWVI